MARMIVDTLRKDLNVDSAELAPCKAVEVERNPPSDNDGFFADVDFADIDFAD